MKLPFSPKDLSNLFKQEAANLGKILEVAKEFGDRPRLISFFEGITVVCPWIYRWQILNVAPGQ